METRAQLAQPRPLILSFWPEIAAGITSGSLPWEFRKRRSGHEPGARVLAYASGKVRGIVGAYTVGEVLSYEDLDDLVRALMARGFGEAYLTDDLRAKGFNASVEAVREYLDWYLTGMPQGFAFEVRGVCAFNPPLSLGHKTDGSKAKGPQGFCYLDPANADHTRLWREAQALQ